MFDVNIFFMISILRPRQLGRKCVDADYWSTTQQTAVGPQGSHFDTVLPLLACVSSETVRGRCGFCRIGPTLVVKS